MEKTLIVNGIYFIISYILIFLIYLLVINRKRKVYQEGKKASEINYIINKFKLDMRSTSYNKLKWAVTIVNPLIISITFIIVINIKSFTLGMIIGFIAMLMLTYAFYEIIGRYLKKRGKKNV